MKTPRARGLVKSAVARALSWSGADALLGTLARSPARPVVLGYHRVVEDFAAAARVAIPAMLTSRRMLEAQLDWIGRRYQWIALDELGARLSAGEPFDRPAAAVTFDDGYRDVYDVAFPLLQKKGIPAGVFVVTDVVGTGRTQIHDRLHALVRRGFERWADPGAALRTLLARAEIRESRLGLCDGVASGPLRAVVSLLRGLSRAEVERVADAIGDDVGIDGAATAGMEPLTWDMLAEMSRAGVVVGSHTRRHAWLTRESPASVLEEVRGSREEIERRLGTAVEHFAYPDGCFDGATVTRVASAGYRFGYTTCTHRDPRHPLLTLPRRMLWERSCVDADHDFSPAVMSCQVHGVWSLVNGCALEHGS